MMTPKEIVHELDHHIIGQNDAKKSVAIALRNRWRRSQTFGRASSGSDSEKHPDDWTDGVSVKPKSLVALQKLANAPFIKVEATKYTEVGYVGREVDSIIKDLVESAVKMVREQEMVRVQSQAADIAENQILDTLLPPARGHESESYDNMAETRQKIPQAFARRRTG